MEVGKRTWVSDEVGLPLPPGDDHVRSLWFMSDNQEVVARLRVPDAAPEAGSAASLTEEEGGAAREAVGAPEARALVFE